MFNKLIISLTALILISGAGLVLAQEDAATLDEDVQAQELEVEEPRILPDSPFYFFKEWGRGIQGFFTFNPIAKAKLKEKFANEKLIELKKMVEQEKSQEKIEKGIENYQNEVAEAKRVIERIKETAEENIEVGKFLDKFTQQQVLHQRILQKLETQVPPEVFAKIELVRERHLEKFGEVMTKLENKEKIQERLEKNLEAIKGSQFKNFKNLEVLKELESKAPEEAKDAIQKAQENALKRLQGDLEKMSPEDQERFKEYLERISGEKEKHLEILENLKAKIKEAPPTLIVLPLLEKLEAGKIKIFEKIEEKLKKLGCPVWTPPIPGFCKEGRVIVEKDPETGCSLSPKCIIPGETEILPKPPMVCITLWDPVCGKDDKTYSNACFANLTGVEIAYKGKCEERECQTDADCPQLRCGPGGIRCIGVKAKCVGGQCQTVPVEVCKNLCGDGICQEIVCLAIGCPCPETKETCPVDCK